MLQFTTAPIIDGNDWFVSKPVLEKSLEWQLGILGLFTVLAVMTLIYSIVLARRIRSPYPVYTCIGAGLATFYEPLGDFLAHVTYHEAQQLNFTVAFGYQVPLWVLPTYVIFFGFPTLWLLARIERGITMRLWFLSFAIGIVGAFAFEAPLLAMRSIEYYGANQPLQILGYPLWMAFANVCTMFAVATLVYFFVRSSVGRQYPMLLVPLMPVLVLTGNAGPALPLGSAINATLDVGIVNVAAVLSMLAATLYVWICGRLVCRPADASVRC